MFACRPDGLRPWKVNISMDGGCIHSCAGRQIHLLPRQATVQIPTTSNSKFRRISRQAAVTSLPDADSPLRATYWSADHSFRRQRFLRRARMRLNDCGVTAMYEASVFSETCCIMSGALRIRAR